ncbi:hypothetical protein [Microbacterium sp. SD291]|uniref:hypothetical protein n=1 Tax=Microbacterium sp. SD291 TaxID=2782007 RepID=UPI001A97C209|nr:hypothetical protein [Microbacterium sp. SD291]MBO0979897.1 hypothetical protein [Microbacterium sp. SD291]
MRIKFQNIPPADTLPKGAHTLLKEISDLHQRRRAAVAVTLELRPSNLTGGLDDTAQAADAHAVATATRKGTTLANPTEHQDALTARRDAADQQVAALERAIEAADRDLDTWVQQHHESILTHQQQRLADTADTLTDMLASIAPARAAYDEARAALAWTDRAEANSIVSWTITSSGNEAPRREHTDSRHQHHGADPI